GLEGHRDTGGHALDVVDVAGRPAGDSQRGYAGVADRGGPAIDLDRGVGDGVGGVGVVGTVVEDQRVGAADRERAEVGEGDGQAAQGQGAGPVRRRAGLNGCATDLAAADNRQVVAVAAVELQSALEREGAAGREIDGQPLVLAGGASDVHGAHAADRAAGHD